jgi:hypothetical protein
MTAKLVRWAIVLGTAIVLEACSSWSPVEPSLAGWPLGAETPCEIPEATEPKYDRVAIASESARLAPRDIKDVRCFGEGGYLNDGKPFLLTRTGSLVVVVFTLADGSQRAVGISCHADCRTLGPPSSPTG